MKKPALFCYNLWVISSFVLLTLQPGLSMAQQSAAPIFNLKNTDRQTFNLHGFKDPDKSYGPLAFWSWNDELEVAELRTQIKKMDEGGWGGFFMHARVGLITPYLSTKWFDAIKASIDEAQKRGLQAWMYDENKWPSGTANLTMAFKDKAFRETHLFVAKDSILHATEDVTVYKQQAIANADGTKSNYYFYKWKAPLKSARFGGGSYVDLMNADMTKEFIRSVHDKYKVRIGKDFGKTVPGIFTDDLTTIWDLYGQKKMALPWTDKMPEAFKAMHGYDITENVEKLYFPLPGYEKVRLDFYRTVNKLFSENYWKVLYDWCEENNLKSTGHHMGDGLPFSDLMQDMQYQQVPGMDLLSYGESHLLTLRCITSVANQLRKERTLCEAFAASGHNLSFEDQKWLTNHLFVNGVNTITAHIYQYSFRGDRKRDHPPAMSHQQPWWKYNKLIADYQARASYLLTRGKRIADILLLYPAESMGMAYTPYNQTAYQNQKKKFDATMNYLLQNQLDFDFGSEELLSKYGSVDNKELKVGFANYGVVLLPSTIRTLRQSTYELLHRYLDKGGLVFAEEKLPDLIDGLPMTEEQKKSLARIKVVLLNGIKTQLSAVHPPELILSGVDKEPLTTMRYSLRKDEGRYLYFITNQDNKKNYEVTLSVKARGALFKLNLETGEKKPIEQWTDGQRIFTKHLFYAAESVALLVDTAFPVTTNRNPIQARPATTILQIDSVWNMRLKDDNALTIDYCRYSVDGKNFSAPVYVLDMSGVLSKDPTIKYIRYVANSTFDYQDTVSLVLETPEKFIIKVNGQKVHYEGAAYYLDNSFKKIAIQNLLKKGENYIDLEIITKDQLAIESIYLCGKFGVEYAPENQFIISPLKTAVVATDLTKQGLPFFAGSVTLSKQIEVAGISPPKKYTIKLDSLNATVAHISINGRSAGVLLWKPYTLDITPYLKNAKNNIEITLTNSLHNLLGYHHSSRRARDLFVGAGEFNNKENWTDEYCIFPLGISKVGIIEPHGLTATTHDSTHR